MTFSVLIGICLYSAFDFPTIHQIEYNLHKSEAEWTPVSSTKLPYVPLEPGITGMAKNYYGYLPYWTDTSYYQYFQIELLTHISYFSVDIDPSTGSLGSIPNASRFYKIRDYAHPRGVRIHMTFTVFGNTNVTNFLNNATARNNAVNNIRNFMTNYGCDGANIDFEFVTSAVRDSFNRFINDLAYALWNHPNGRKELYLATPAVPEWYPGYDFSYLGSHSDGLFIMAYDYHWSGSSVAGPVSPCIPSPFWGQYCVAKSIGSYKVYGVPGSKIVLGLPYYGYDWPTASGDIGSSTTGTGSAVIYYYAFQNANTYGRLWDNYSQTPWYRYNSGGWHQCWYDDSVSLDIKFGMVNDSILQGAGCWALGYDRSYDHIWNAIRRRFWIEPPTRHWTVEVNIDSLNVRDGPGTNYRIITEARLGTKFVSFDYYYNQGVYWYKVYFPSASGPYYVWMSGGDGTNSQYMKGTTRNTILRINSSLVNVREGPGASYPVITQVANGQVFVADSFSGNWARIYLQLTDKPRGWVYIPYTIINNPEDYNTYNCSIQSLTYPSTVNSLDTFTVSMHIQNTGYGPFDTLVYLKGTGRSPFYYPATWKDTIRAKLTGFWGLPGQVFYNYAKFRAPSVPNQTTIADTFRFERNGVLFGPQIIVSVVVNPVGIGEKQHLTVQNQLIKETIFSKELHINLTEIEIPCEIFVYNILGERIIHKKVYHKQEIHFGQDLKSGVYFVVLKTPDKIIKTKIIKIN
ncbi:MAG: glycosyl hydrolase family 18 protein [candidate division WOR-3 bacterium]